MILKVIFANSVDPDQTDLGPHCLPVSKTRFEKSARIFSRPHKQTTFSDTVFLGALRVKWFKSYGGDTFCDGYMDRQIAMPKKKCLQPT